MENVIEIIKMIGGWIIYPFVIAFASIKIAKFHFEKDIKKQYLFAKDKVANDILNSLCGMLLNMWELVNINSWIATNQIEENSPETQQKRQIALSNFYNFFNQNYSQLGQMGLYYGAAVVDLIAQLQSEWNNMVNTNDFSVFENWDDYRRQKVLPVLQRVHTELKNTVFDQIKSFRLYT